MVSGGVASNLAVREGLVRLVKHFNMEAVFPPPRLCTDNGVMIAWAGLEALKINETGVAPKDVLGVEVLPTKDFSFSMYPHVFFLQVQSRCPLGGSIHEKVLEANIKCKWVKL